MNRFKNNKGFALVELLVVLAIMAVAVGAFAIASSNISANNARRCVLNASAAVSRTKINSLYRPDPVFISFHIHGGNIVADYYEGDEDGDPILIDSTIIGAARMGFTVELGNTPLSLPVDIGFSRGKGRLLIRNNEGNFIEANQNLKIHVGDSAYILEIVYLTGNHEARIGGS